MIHNESSAKAWLETLPEYDATAKARLIKFVEILTEENARQNLVATSSLDHVWQRHIADSAQLLRHVPRETGATWLDIGTGAGFPGLVISALRPDMQVLMVESRSKRAAWLSYASLALNLTEAQVIFSRLELVATQPVAVISARAFAPLDRLLKLSARFSTADTLWLLPKGRSAAHELKALVGGGHMFNVEQSLTDREAGLIVGRLNGEAGHCR